MRQKISLSLILSSLAIVVSCESQVATTDGTSPTAGIEPYFMLDFNKAERDSLQSFLEENQKGYEAIYQYAVTNSVPPAFDFNPIPVGFEFKQESGASDWGLPENVTMPENKNELAFYSVAEQATLIRNRKITAVELTQLYLDRLKKYGDTLKCSITLLEERALQKAAEADKEIQSGNYRGPLHGIPFGVKDLFALSGYKTTWGAMAYKDQEIDQTATVIKKLEDAGAVLVAKLTLGALAMGDVWYGGMTRNPWNPKQGSSGSSAGSAAATAAGLVAFSIGTETWGSIVSPSTRCGTSGLRPTYGRVSRTGAMALSWTMDKVGPICRSAHDCALVFDAIHGKDGIDRTLIDQPFVFNAKKSISQLKIGYVKSGFDADYENKKNDQEVLNILQNLGAEPEALELPKGIPMDALVIILSAEGAAAFDQLTRTDQDSLLVRQGKNAWPNFFRAARFIPAVEYIQANRIRYQLIQQFHEIIKKYDVVVCPSFAGTQLLMTNLTGHPAVVVPNGFNKEGSPASITFLGNLYDEASVLSVAKAYQDATDIDEKHPDWLR